MDRVVSASRPEWVELFAGVPPRAFRRLVAQVARRGGRAVADGVNGRQWSLPLDDRVLLVAMYYRTNLTMRQLAPLFGIKTAAVHRIVDRLGPFLALAPARKKYGPDTVLIVDGTLVPTRDRAVAASSKNYRTSVNMQVLIDADSRLVVAVGQPQPGNRNDCTAWTTSKINRAAADATVLADGGYQGTRLLMPHRRKAGQSDLPPWKERNNTDHRRVRARVEHTFAAMKCWKILPDCRRRGHGVYWATTGVAHLRNLALSRPQRMSGAAGRDAMLFATPEHRMATTKTPANALDRERFGPCSWPGWRLGPEDRPPGLDAARPHSGSEQGQHPAG